MSEVPDRGNFKNQRRDTVIAESIAKSAGLTGKTKMGTAVEAQIG